jgi:hypothetical protein
MVSDRKVKRLRKEMAYGKSQKGSAISADINRKTARKYLRSGKLPSEMKTEHTWRTRIDPFARDMEWVRVQLGEEPALEAKTLFEELQRQSPGTYQDGQLRTLQRSIKQWRALEGPSQEIYFPQEHKPGVLCASDFTHMTTLRITINLVPYEHMLYHFVLTYSNWETATICMSESFESLSNGLQNALWELQGVPEVHLTDSLSAAIKKLQGGGKEFTDRYDALLRNYHLEGRHTQSASPNENGDVEQSNHRLKRCVNQALMLRGSRNFSSVDEYSIFLRKLFKRKNAGRQKRLDEELPLLRKLPARRFESVKEEFPIVGQGSTISVQGNVYSLHSRLIGSQVEARISGETVAVWFANKKIDEFPRFRGKGHARIDYRHIIDMFVRKPGAFEDYRYREELFPTHYYRMAYDALSGLSVRDRAKNYLRILQLAADHGEVLVQQAIRSIIESGEVLIAANVETLALTVGCSITPLAPYIAAPDLRPYEALCGTGGLS